MPGDEVWFRPSLGSFELRPAGSGPKDQDDVRLRTFRADSDRQAAEWFDAILGTTTGQA